MCELERFRESWRCEKKQEKVQMNESIFVGRRDERQSVPMLKKVLL
jgi:hypothetical protein